MFSGIFLLLLPLDSRRENKIRQYLFSVLFLEDSCVMELLLGPPKLNHVELLTK